MILFLFLLFFSRLFIYIYNNFGLRLSSMQNFIVCDSDIYHISYKFIVLFFNFNFNMNTMYFTSRFSNSCQLRERSFDVIFGKKGFYCIYLCLLKCFRLINTRTNVCIPIWYSNVNVIKMNVFQIFFMYLLFNYRITE